MGQIVILVKLTAREGMRDQLAEVLAKVGKVADTELGTLVYVLSKDIADPAVLWAFHVYADQEAFEIHRVAPGLKTAQEEMKPFLAHPYEVIKTTPLGGKNRPDRAHTDGSPGNNHVVAIVKMIALEGQRPQVVKLMEDLVKVVEEEPGTLAFLLLADNKDPNVLWEYQVYANQQVFEEHRVTPALKSIQAMVKPLLTGNSYQVFKTTPLGGKGLSA